jgi:hypothetical protein
MAMRAVIAGIALLLLALATWRLLVGAGRGTPSGRWFVVLVASVLVCLVTLLW